MQNKISLPFQSIYLAGKISKNDWRGALIYDPNGYDEPHCPDNTPPMSWPVRTSAVFGMDYVGPYFRSCDHGCYHGNASHGTDASAQPYSGDLPDVGLTAQNQRVVQSLCLSAIHQADLVFAWIDTHEAYGTFAEIGYAKALGKTVWVVMPQSEKELWFITRLADKFVINETPLDGLKMLIGHTLFDTSLKKNLISLR